jgi:hypothetical protein
MSSTFIKSARGNHETGERHEKFQKIRSPPTRKIARRFRIVCAGGIDNLIRRCRPARGGRRFITAVLPLTILKQKGPIYGKNHPDVVVDVGMLAGAQAG